MSNYYGSTLSTEEVAQKLNISKQMVYSLVRTGKLNPVNLSYGTSRPRYGFYVDEVEAYVLARKQNKDPGYENPYINKTRVELIEMRMKLKKLQDKLMDVCVELDELIKS